MTSVILPYDPTWQALEWAKENCPSYITNESVPDRTRKTTFFVRPHNIIYYFSDPRDATLFILRWC